MAENEEGFPGGLRVAALLVLLGRRRLGRVHAARRSANPCVPADHHRRLVLAPLAALAWGTAVSRRWTADARRPPIDVGGYSM